MYFQIYNAAAGLAGIFGAATPDWRWRLKSANHEIIASGEGYTTKAGCQHAIMLMKQTTLTTPVNEI